MVTLAADPELGINLRRLSSPSFYLALDCVLFSSIASSDFLFSVESLFDFVLFYCLISWFFAVGDRLLFARMGLSAISIFAENEFSIVTRFDV